MTDIAILGSGITGMMTALAFAHHGIKTTIIEKSTSDKFPLDIRTTTFTPRSREFLSQIDIWKLFEHEAGVIKDIYILDNKSPSMLHLDSEYVEKKGYVLPNMFLKESLYKQVKNHPLISLCKGVQYDMPYEENGKVIISDIKVDTLLVCEGRSTSLHKLFEARVSKSYGQAGIISVIEHEKAHEGSAVEHFMPNGTFAALPMKNPRHSSVVWTESEEVANLYLKLPIEKLTMHLQERMGEFLGKIKIISEMQTFPLTARVTKKYYEGNIVLIGDAAHAIHPLAGQGLNQGIKDIKAITEIISNRIKLGLDIDALAYDEYTKARNIDNFSMFLVTDNLNRIFSNNIFPLSSLRKLGLRFLDECSFLKKRLANAGSGL